MFALRLIFTGLVAFVPVDNQERIVPPDSPHLHHVWVLLVDGRNPHPPYDNDGKPLDSHFAALRYDPENARDSLRRHDQQCVDQGGPLEECVVTFLNMEEIKIVPNTSDAPTPPKLAEDKRHRDDVIGKPWPVPCCNQSSSAHCPNAPYPWKCFEANHGHLEQIASFDWLISLDELGAELDPDSWNHTPTEGRIIARLRIDRGRLSTFRMIEEKKGDEIQPDRYRNSVRLEFRPRVIEWSARAAAKQVVLEISGIQDVVSFKSRRFDGHTSPDDLTIKPIDGQSVVEVEMMNTPNYQILDPDPGHLSESNRHFEVIWRLVQDPPFPRPAPFSIDFINVDLLCPEVRP